MRAKWRSLAVVGLAVAGVVVLALSGSMTAVVSLAGVTALIMGGTFIPVPGQAYLDAQTQNYMTGPGFFTAVTSVGVTTPEEFWPVNGGTLTFDKSVALGVTDLDGALADHPDQPLAVLGYSQSTRIASIKKRQLIDDFGDDFAGYPDLAFVLVSDVNKGNGGILERFNGLFIPILEVTFDGAIATDSPQNPDNDGDYALDTKDITFIHDGWSDFPIYPLNLLAVANAAFGIAYLHSTYPTVTEPDLVGQGSYGDTDYYVIGTDIVPLLRPLAQIGVPKPILLAVDEPLRVMIETGYRRDINPGAPTTAYLIPIANPISDAVNLVTSIPVGLDDAAQEMGMGRPLGTGPSGVYGVGGEDADLAGLPPGLIPLGAQHDSKESESTTAIGDFIVGSGKGQPAQDNKVTTSSIPEGEDGTQPAAEPAEEPAGTGEATAEPKPDRPKALRPKVRGPIEFDSPSLRKPAEHPIRRVLDALSGGPSEPTAAEAVDSGESLERPDGRTLHKPRLRSADRPSDRGTQPGGENDAA